ncbi:MAG: hypothetical protein QXM12_01695 [Nitrososphaerota archaeon]
MARKRSSRALVYGIIAPEVLARNVVGKYVSEGRTNLTNWVRTYRTNVTAYLDDTRKQEQVSRLLGGWYNIFLEQVYPTLTEVYARAKSAYTSRKKSLLAGGTVVPPA